MRIVSTSIQTPIIDGQKADAPHAIAKKSNPPLAINIRKSGIFRIRVTRAQAASN
jgi:hypothetical protein